jgi:hypothetical protein
VPAPNGAECGGARELRRALSVDGKAVCQREAESAGRQGFAAGPRIMESMDMDNPYLAINLSSIIVAGLILLAGFPH